MATRVILLDDRPQDRFLAKRALAAEFPDMELAEVRDAGEFHTALDRRDADVIITDYQLRWSDGLQVLADVRAKGLDTPVVMFTHTGSEEIAAAGLKAGLSDYIIKTPTHYGRLAHAVRVAIQNAAAARSERDARARERKALRTAEEALRSKDEFLATLSHELRTPLNAISGWLQIVQAHPDPDRLQRGLTAIGRNTAVLTRLIADLVDVSRIVTGTLTLQIQPTDVRKIVDAALDSVRPAIQGKRLRVEVIAPERLPPAAADPDRLQQIVWNLLSNAVKFTAAEGLIVVRLTTGASTVDVSVEDNGSGIRAEFLPRVFDRFSQQDASLTREHGGMGLGLAIVRHLVEMHGGTIGVTSTEGVGSAFTVRFPVHAEAAATPAAEERASQRGTLTGLRVLVIDDDPDARDVVERMLADEGAQVETATSAADGYAALTRTRPDVLVCDLGMPSEDGLRFISRVRTHPDPDVASVPALAVTAYAHGFDRQRSLDAGFHSHLSKPFAAADLVSVVQHLAHFGDSARHGSART
jgi:signal transduction histidine kinase